MVVVDNCILSSLAKIDRLDLLRKFFKNIETPFSVLRELQEEKLRGFEFVKRIEKITTFSEKKLSKERWLLITPLNDLEIKLSNEIKLQTQVSEVDADTIAIAKNRNKILLTDDTYAGNIAQQRGVKVFDLKTFLEACVIDGLIKTSNEIKQIISALKKKDFYEFSEEDKYELLSLFEK